MRILKLKPFSSDIRSMYRFHEHYHDGDAGLDLFFPYDTVISGGTLGEKIPLGISCEMVGEEPTLMYPFTPNSVSFNIYPRSSIAKTPLRLSNSIGLIDAGYRGELMALVDNHSDEDYQISAGDRLFQIVAMDGSPFSMKITDELSDSARGTDGVGSTGK